MVAPRSDPSRSAASPSAFGRLAGKVGGHSLVYALASATAILGGLAGLAVFTRYLVPAEYGRLAILLAASSILTLLLNLGTLQGTNALVYGAAGEDGEAESDDDPGKRAHDTRRALATGLSIPLVAGIAATLVVTGAESKSADLLTGDPGRGNLVIWAAAGGALAAVWRVAANAIRLERRPGAYLATTGSQHLLGVIFAIPLLTQGRGIEAVLIGTAAGNAVALLVALVLIRRSIRPAVSWRDAREIFRRGRAYLPITSGMYFIQVADVLLLSRFVSTSQVGLFRVASRFGSFVSYWTTSFQMAWGSMRRDPLAVAADRERGAAAVASLMATYFSLITFGVVLTASVFSEELVSIAAPEFAGAADYIPLCALAWAGHGFYVLSYRASDFPAKRTWFAALTVVNAVVFLLSAYVWIPLFGTYGISLAALTGWLTGTVGLLWRGQRGPRPVPFQWARISAGFGMACAVLLADKELGASSGAVQYAVDTGAVILYLILLAGLRIVPGDHILAGVQVLRSARADRLSLRRGATLTADEHDLLEALLRRQRPPDDVAAATGLSPTDVLQRFVTALRGWAGAGPPRESDALLGSYLLMQGAFADREQRAREIFAAGVDPLDADGLKRAARSVRRVSNRRWQRAAPPGAGSWPPGSDTGLRESRFRAPS